VLFAGDDVGYAVPIRAAAGLRAQSEIVKFWVAFLQLTRKVVKNRIAASDDSGVEYRSADENSPST
jgi:hypothetical protein